MTTKTGQSTLILPFSAKVTLIPSFVDGKFTGKPYKAEQNLYRDDQGGARMHLWFEPDPRPHNHPWRWIGCKVLRGGYVADEWEQLPDGSYNEIPSDTVRLNNTKLGEHRVLHPTYHQVTEVQPGTVSIMTFGPIVGNAQNWGNLVFKDGKGVHDSNTSQPGFIDALRHLNPHMRPADWVSPFDFPVPSLDELLTAVK